MTANECPHCRRDRSQYIVCCDEGEKALLIAAKEPKPAAKKKRTRLISADLLDQALAILIADGAVETVTTLDDEIKYRLTPKGELLSKAIGKPPYGDA